MSPLLISKETFKVFEEDSGSNRFLALYDNITFQEIKNFLRSC